ncbi:hypothetical protein EDB84DRAFT_1476895 [Lactarius hengduanensis]|nr:hypothetical protein EDB84DRAFT_1476895 [Lactarius hengduanensis]
MACHAFAEAAMDHHHRQMDSLPSFSIHKTTAATIGRHYDEGRMASTSMRVARIFNNTYRARMNPYDGRVVSKFITQALPVQDLDVYSDSSQTCLFRYIDDFITLMNSSN